jgi:hypothetical protein
MKNKIIVCIIALFIGWSTTSFAGVLMQQWTEGTSRYCKYSDGQVEEISYGSTCSSTN